MSLPPFATSVRMTCATGSVPLAPISCTTLLEPSPITGNISFVPGIRRCGIVAPCASAFGDASAATPAAASAPVTNSRRVVVSGWLMARSSSRRRAASLAATSFGPRPGSVRHRMHEKIRAETECVGGRFQWVTGASVPLPEIREVVVVQRDHRDLAFVVVEAVVHGIVALHVRIHAVQVFHFVREIEDWIVFVEALEAAVAEYAPHLLAQVVHMLVIEVVDEH